MGVPAFYRWIREKYPKCIEDCVEDMPGSADGVEIPVHVAGPNPNGIEFDNLYIDMNGVIHPCVHPEDVPAPKTVEEMFAAIIAYVDRLMAAVRPRRLVYLAIDGVAPRAKMNQQRSRRFKAAQEMAEEEEVEARLRASLVSKGQKVPPKKAHTFDHNVITPGTWFMDQLSIHLRYHITQRVNAVPGWRDVRVILSDASVPGEGEHKIMDFIRQQRAAPGYNPNTVHCIHGLDADLIMLALATHEPRFSILREDVLGKAGGASKCFVCGREGHTANQCTGAAAPPPSWEAAEEDAAAAAAGKKGSHDDAPNSLRSLITRKPLQFLHIPILREYLDLEFRPYVAPLLPPGWGAVGATSGGPGAAAAAAAAGAIVPHAGGGAAGPLPSPYSTERVIDDFVFLCFFCGNDFLPHLPSMDIREGAIDLLLALYKQLLPGLGGYLTEGGHVNLARVDVLLGRVGAAETEIFRRRRVKEERDAQREAQRNGQKRAEAAARDRRAAASALAGDAAGAAASGGAGLLPAPVSGVGAGGIGSVSLAGAGSRRPRNGGGVDSGSVGPDDSVSVAGDAAGGTEAGSGKVKGKGKGLLGGRKEAASAAYRSATGAAEAALKEGMAAMVADKKKAAAAAAAPAGGAAAAAYAPSSPLLAPPPAKRGRHTTFNEAGQASGAEGAADGVDPAAPPATGAAAPVADAANRSAAQDLRSKLLGLRPLLDKAAAAAPAASEAPAAAAVAAGAGSAESEAHPPSMQLDAAAAAAAAAPADAAAPAPAAAGAGEGAGEGELFIPDDAYEHGVEMAAQRRKLQAAEAARAARAGGPDETEGEAEGEASQHAAVSGSGDASTVVSEAASGVGAGGGFASAVSVVTAASEDGLSTAVSAVSTGVGGLAGAGEEEDDSPHTAALEAEALEEGVVEAEVAAAITGQLKTAVLQALLEKRTHEGVADEVRLGSAGDRDRYYKAKFGEEAGSDPAFIRGVCRSYIEGLVWVYRYYYAGVASWKWFYPHHYAPFASDLRGLDSMAPITFELGRPFRPLDQLMGVLPPRSAHALPPACTALMTQEDSPVRDFYPEKFDMDPNGKRYTWQWVVLLPFIDEGRLVGAIDSVAATFSAEERRRNTLGSDLLFVHQQGGIAKYLLPLFKLPLAGAAPAAAAAAAAAAGAGTAKTADGLPAEAADGAPASGAAASAASAPAAAAPAPSAPAPAAAAAAAAPAPAPGSIPVVSLKPHMGDANHKGLTAQCLRVSDAPAGQRGVVAPACPAGSLPSPWDPVLPPLSNLYVVTVAMCLPPRRAHVCSLLAGVEPTLPVLDPADDDPSSRIPRLTKGMCVADLAYALAAETNSAAYGASLQRGVAAMPVAAAMLGGGGGRGHYGGGGGGSYAGYGGSAAAGGYGAGAGGAHHGGFPQQYQQQPYPGHHSAAPPQHLQVGGFGHAYTAPAPGGFHGPPPAFHYPQQYQQQQHYPPQPSAAQRTVLSSLGIRPAEGGAGAAGPGGYPPHPGYGGPAAPPARPFSFGAGGGGGRGAPGPGGAYGAAPMMMAMGGAGGHPAAAAGGAGMGMGPVGAFAGPAGYGAAPPPYGGAPGFGAPRPGYPHHAPPPQQPFSFARR